jgi:hypothetical protein
MRTKYLQKFSLTRKRFKLILAIIGLLAAWLIALSGLVLTSSLASAERSFDGRTRHASLTARKGAGISYSDSSSQAVAHDGGAKVTQNEHALCDDRLPRDGRMVRCYPVFTTNKNSDTLGEGSTISSGSLQSSGGGNGRQDFDAGVVNSASGESLAVAFSGFSPLGLSSSFGTSGGGTISPAGQAVSAQTRTDALADIDDGSKTGDESALDLSEGLAYEAKWLAEKVFPATPYNLDSPSIIRVDDDPSLGEGAPPVSLPHTTQPVPEPLTLSLFGAALLGMMAMRRANLISFGRYRHESRCLRQFRVFKRPIDLPK